MPKSYTVNKADLRAKLITNRDEHADQFERAQVAYREAVIKVLDRRLEETKAGGKIRTYIDLREPEEHTDAYDLVLEGLDWEIADEVVLDPTEFNRLVLNRWEWSASFAANTQSYLAS